MSEFFAEATVRLTPDVTGFATELRRQVKAAVEKVEGTPAARVRVSPVLTRNFVGELRRQVNAAVIQAQRGIKPIQVRAVLSDVSRVAIAREVRAGAQTVRAATPPAADPRIPQRIEQTTKATRDLIIAERLAGTAFGRSATDLRRMTSVQEDLTKARKVGTVSIAADVAATRTSVAATELLAAAQRELAVAQQFGATSLQRASFIKDADRLAARAAVQATEDLDLETRKSVDAFRAQIRTVEGGKEALREHSRAATATARAHSQLRRGVLATGLSFLGIRGATLAASASFLVGAASIALFAKALQASTAFADQINVFRATVGATVEELARVRNAARALGADLTLPGVTATDAAQAMTELAKAGLGVQDSIEGARGVLQLATAAAIDNAQATELAANAINAFGLAGRDATHVADVFANAANAAQGSIVDIGIAFQQAAAAGRQTGLSFEDTTTFLTILQREGLRGSDAGTSLRTALIRLIRPTKEAAAEIKRLGIETRDAQGNLRPDIFIQVAQATKDLSPAARDAAVALLGGQDAFRAFTILGRQSIRDFIRLRRELRNQGTAADLAGARMEGLRGQIEGLSNVLATGGVRIGQGLTPALSTIVGGLTGVAAGMSESTLVAQSFGEVTRTLELGLSALGQTLQTLGPIYTTFIGVQARAVNTIGLPTILAAIAAYKLFPPVLARASASMTAFGAATGRAAFALRLLRDPAITGKLSFLASSFNLTTLAISAAAAALIFFATRESEAERATRRLQEATEGLTRSIGASRAAQVAARDAALSVNQARLGVFQAEAAAEAARTALTRAGAERGTFARTKLELQLAVALDNVKVAENNLRDATRRGNETRDLAIAAARLRRDAAKEEIDALKAVASIRREVLTARGTQSPAEAAENEAKAVRGVVEALRERAQAARKELTPESVALAKRLELLANISEAVDKIPTDRAIEIAIEAPNIKVAMDRIIREFGVTGKAARDALIFAISGEGAGQLRAALNNLLRSAVIDFPDLMDTYARRGAEAFGDSLSDGLDQQVPKVEAAATRIAAAALGAIKRSLGRAAGLEVGADLITIATGAPGAQLPNLQAQLEEARRRQRIAEEAIARSIAAGGPGETPSLREARRQAIADQARILAEIRSVNEGLAADAKAAADEAAQKRQDRDENFLKALGLKREAAEQRILDAGLTEGVADNLRFTRRLRQLIQDQIQSVRERIADARKAGVDVSALIEGLRELRGLWRDLGREVRELNAERKREIQERIAERNQLDIEFAQTTENKRAEIRARLREISRLKRLQDLTKRGTLEYKRYRNLIAEQRKAIKSLREELAGRDDLFHQMTFDFLSRQQGFAATLLGNLLPLGVAGTTVAAKIAARGADGATGTTTPGGREIPRGILEAERMAGANAAGRIAAPTRGQQTVEIDVLRQILAVLRQIGGTSKHPENKRQNRMTRAAFDNAPGGP